MRLSIRQLGDSLVRAAATASSLEVEQDIGNITKTLSKATPNESSSLGTTSGGNTLRSDKDRLKLDELMVLCTTLQIRVLDLEKKKTTQQNKIASLKRRVEKLEKKDEDITIVSVQDDADKEMFDVDALNGEEVFVASSLMKKTTLNLQAEFDEEERLAREKAEKTACTRTEELSIEEKATLFQQLLEKRRKHFAAKRAEEKKKQTTNKSSTEKDNVITKKQKVEDDKETAELKQLMEIIPDEEEVAIDAIPLVVKSPSIVGWKIYKEGRKSYYQIIRADGKSQMYMIFSQMLKSFDREDLEDLYKLVKAKYESTRPVEDLDLLLWDLYVGREEVSSYTIYTFNDVGKEAYN
ncbi:hypothetical protein Tco_1250175 [Tanacetum coccineum]